MGAKFLRESEGRGGEERGGEWKRGEIV